jgi:methyl-accepting chemotaxis protein
MKRSLIGAFTLACCLTACSYQAQIDKATQQAGASAQLASAAAANAQNSAKQAAEASLRAQEAAAGAWNSVNRANNAIARLERRPDAWSGN